MKTHAILVFAAATALVLITVAWTGQTSTASNARATATGTWTPGGKLPGVRLVGSHLSARGQMGVEAVVAISNGIDAGSLREVVSGGTVRLRMRLVTARGPGGAACSSFITDSGGGLEFSCFDSPSGDGALVRYAASGGSTVNTVDWTTLVGLARSDVSRVTVVTQNGAERPLGLNQWRGFTYSAASAGDFPAALRAYGADGSVIDEVQTLP